MTTETTDQNKIRNIAIIAHVDHGKTTLVDAFLKQTNLFRQNQKEMSDVLIMDSGELEREKGITIKAKNASVYYKDYKINIIDTPGHSDFGGEVERTLNLAEGALLIVDAQEGPMPQTKFVLKKALELKLKIIVIINKIDKKFSDAKKALDKVNDLFLSLVTDESQLDFPILYAIGRQGKIFEKFPENFEIEADIKPLLEKIIEFIPAPSGNNDEPFRMQVVSTEFDEHHGQFLIGKINRGKIKVNDSVTLAVLDDENSTKIIKTGKIKNIRIRKGLIFQDTDLAQAGEIIAVAGIDSTYIGATLCSSEKVEPLPMISITPPSVKITIEPNTSPFSGKDGKFVTFKQLEQRLLKEKESNIALNIEKSKVGKGYEVSGRGELQLEILIETMRRENYEFQIKKPEVIFQEKEGKLYEPLEEVTILIPEEFIGLITTELSDRFATLIDMQTESDQVKFVYDITTQNLLGLRSKLISQTNGKCVIYSFQKEYIRSTGQISKRKNGVIISCSSGKTSGYSLNTIQERGNLLIGPSEEVYEGMIIGINKYENDLEVDPTKERRRSAHRIKHDEITQTELKSRIKLDISFAMSFLESDELLEITPNHLRLRKYHLTKTERIWSRRKSLTDFAKQQLSSN